MLPIDDNLEEAQDNVEEELDAEPLPLTGDESQSELSVTIHL